MQMGGQVECNYPALARNSYESERPDPADNVFSVAERLRRQQNQTESSPSLPDSP